jgi:hypothetical protein
MHELSALHVACQAFLKGKTRLWNGLKTQSDAFVLKQGRFRVALKRQQLRDMDTEICRPINSDNLTARAVEIIMPSQGLVRCPLPPSWMNAQGSAP